MTATEPICDRQGLYTSRQAAEILGVDVSTIRRASRRTDDGALPYKVRKANNQRVYRGEDIIRWWRLCY